MGVDDRARLVAAVDAEVEVELGGRLEGTMKKLAVEVDDRHVVRIEVRQDRPRGCDRDSGARTHAYVPGGPEDEPLLREPPPGPGHRLALGFQHARQRI
jgi:hypothetical protein